MSIKIGSTGCDSIYLGSTKIGAAYLGNTKVFSSSDPCNPLGLPSHTIRIKYEAGQTPSGWLGDSQTLVDADENIWDIYKSSNDWSGLFVGWPGGFYTESVLGANTTGVTNMSSLFDGCSFTSVPLFDTSSVTDMSDMFYRCLYLTSVPLFDTSSVTDMTNMFNSCSSLTSVPLFDTSSATDMSEMFASCTALTNVPLFDTSSATNTTAMFASCERVQSGALALYNQASTQTTPPATHTNMFMYCGAATLSGRAELEQIPISWGGLGA